MQGCSLNQATKGISEHLYHYHEEPRHAPPDRFLIPTVVCMHACKAAYARTITRSHQFDSIIRTSAARSGIVSLCMTTESPEYIEVLAAVRRSNTYSLGYLGRPVPQRKECLLLNVVGILRSPWMMRKVCSGSRVLDSLGGEGHAE